MNPQSVWYVSYGSNMCRARFMCYLEGGTPAGAAQAQPGARDRRPPAGDRAVWIDGLVYFAGASRSWGGAVAFLDPDAPGRSPARAYLISAGQFCDVAAQEAGRAPGSDFDLAGVISSGRQATGPGRYETLVRVGGTDDTPMLTFTSPWRVTDVEPGRPSAGYAATIAAGLAETHGMSPEQASAYLTGLPGCSGG